MSKRKDKSTETDPINEAGTKVIATIVKPARPIETTDVSVVVDPEYAAAIENVKAALSIYGRSAWQLAWALLDFKAAHQKAYPTERLTDKQLANVLAIKLTHQRIGQLMNTAKAFPRDEVDESIDFTVYDRARTTHKLMSPEKRLALVKENPTVAAVNKLNPKGRRQDAAVRRELTIRVTSSGMDAGGPKITVRLNSTEHTLPADLVEAIRTYAVEVFGEIGGTAEAAA